MFVYSTSHTHYNRLYCLFGISAQSISNSSVVVDVLEVLNGVVKISDFVFWPLVVDDIMIYHIGTFNPPPPHQSF